MTLVNVVQGGTIAVLRPLLITLNWKLVRGHVKISVTLVTLTHIQDAS